MSQNYSSSRSCRAFTSRSHEKSATSEPSCDSFVRRPPPVCGCHQICVLRTVGDLGSVNYGKQLWGCRNYKDCETKGCNFFRWYDDDVVDERDLKIARQKRKSGKLKNGICLLKEELWTTRKWLKTSIVVGCVSLGINLVLMTMLFSNGKANGISSMYLN